MLYEFGITILFENKILDFFVVKIIILSNTPKIIKVIKELKLNWINFLIFDRCIVMIFITFAAKNFNFLSNFKKHVSQKSLGIYLNS